MNSSNPKQRPCELVGLPGLLFVGLVITGIRILSLMQGEWELMFDEAQYWLWAQKPDWGYYSKPPVVAWSIWLTTHFCGDAEGCVRLGSPIAHLLASIGIYFAARALFQPQWSETVAPNQAAAAFSWEPRTVAFWSGLVYLTMPAVSFSSMLISTDPFLLCCWAWALYFIVRAIQSGQTANWILAGVATGIGLMSKYAMVLVYPCLLIALLVLPGARRQLFSRGLWLFVVVSLLFLVPNLLWNLDHGMVTFSHTKDNAHLEGPLFHPEEMLAFLSSQLAVFGPILFVVLLWLFLRITRLVAEPRYRLLLAFTLPYLGFFTVVSLLSRAHANWSAPVYVGASILVSAWLLSKASGKFWLKGSVWLHVILGAFMLTFTPSMHLMGVEVGPKSDPFARHRGQRELGEAVSALLIEHPNTHLLASSRHLISPLMYYVNPLPSTAVKWDDDGVINDHYEMMSDIGQYVGESFIYVSEARDTGRFSGRFDTIESLGDIDVHPYKDVTKTYHAFLLSGYHGSPPTTP